VVRTFRGDPNMKNVAKKHDSAHIVDGPASETRLVAAYGSDTQIAGHGVAEFAVSIVDDFDEIAMGMFVVEAKAASGDIELSQAIERIKEAVERARENALALRRIGEELSE
jgi:hypothetical protein